jgi:hypothetical protein
MVDSSLTFGILALVGILVSVFYWMRHTLVPGLLSVLIMYGAGSYWLVMGTSLPVLAWVWYAIALGNLIDFVYRVAYTFGNAIADRWGYSFDSLRTDEDDE